MFTGFCHRKPKIRVSLDEYMDMFVTKEIIDTVEDRNGEEYHPIALGADTFGLSCRELRGRRDLL